MEKAGALAKVSQVIREGNIVAFTGAGISTASGIPDYRGPKGLWKTFDPSDFTIEVFSRNPEYYWKKRIERKKASGIDVLKALPNPAHTSLTLLQEMGLLNEIITQNTVGLHKKAGSKDIIELHGNASMCICPKCGKKYSSEISDAYAEQTGTPPLCDECECPLKPDVVLFGEQLDQSRLLAASRAVSTCRSMLIVGTTASVYPAATLPHQARQCGAKLIEINQEETCLTDEIADISIIGDCSKILPDLVHRLGISTEKLEDSDRSTY